MLPFLIITTVLLLTLTIFCGIMWVFEGIAGGIGGVSYELFWFTLGLTALFAGLGAGIWALVLSI